MKNNTKTQRFGINKRKVVYVGGSYQIINAGHVKSFKKAHSFGDYLIVGLNTDELILDFKKQKSPLPYNQRKIILEGFKYIDKVIPVKEFNPLKILKKYKVDVYCLTREWESTKAIEIAYMKSKGGEVKFLPRFKGVICTSDIKKILLKEAKESD
jgi:glycerol-3-phosphate cytidylyltransferase